MSVRTKVSGTVIDILSRCPLIYTPWDDPCAAQGGLVYHTLNRANARLTIFEDDGDFAAFESIKGVKSNKGVRYLN